MWPKPVASQNNFFETMPVRSNWVDGWAEIYLIIICNQLRAQKFNVYNIFDIFFISIVL